MKCRYVILAACLLSANTFAAKSKVFVGSTGTASSKKVRYLSAQKSVDAYVRAEYEINDKVTFFGKVDGKERFNVNKDVRFTPILEAGVEYKITPKLAAKVTVEHEQNNLAGNKENTAKLNLEYRII